VKTKTPLAWNLKWEPAGDNGVRVRLLRESRTLEGPVGQTLFRRASTGRIRFLDKKPRFYDWSNLQIVGTHQGLAIIRGLHTEHVAMCPRFRNRIVGGLGKVRFARLVA
jgi:hypothetical protein